MIGRLRCWIGDHLWARSGQATTIGVETYVREACLRCERFRWVAFP